jgi:hypothetical protein
MSNLTTCDPEKPMEHKKHQLILIVYKHLFIFLCENRTDIGPCPSLEVADFSAKINTHQSGIHRYC